MGVALSMVRSHERSGAVVDISDAALMTRLAEGDVSALGPLHQRHARVVASLLLRLQPEMSPEQADELCQEVFLTLMDTAARYQDQERLRSWIYGIAVRKARGWQRRVWARRSLLRVQGRRAIGVAAPAQSGIDDRLDARRTIGRALASLPAKQREILVLCVVEELSGEQVAELLGISTGAVWVRLHRARKNLRSTVEAQSAVGGTP